MERKYNVVEIANFIKETKQLSKKYPSIKNDVNNLKEELKDNPFMGESLGDGFYKVRMKIASKGRGKSGGARVITNVKIVKNIVYLADIYDKSEVVTVSKKELNLLNKKIPE